MLESRGSGDHAVAAVGLLEHSRHYGMLVVCNIERCCLGPKLFYSRESSIVGLIRMCGQLPSGACAFSTRQAPDQ